MGNWIFTCTDAKGNEQTDDRQEDSKQTFISLKMQIEDKLYAWKYCKKVV